jgi:hypothetical protein
MARISRTYISWIWVAVVLIYASCTPAYGDVKEPRLTLVFRIINDGQVAQEVVNLAKVRVEQIYGHAGIQIEWSEGADVNQPSTGSGKLDLTMVFVPESVAQTMNRPNEATGFAISNDGQGIRRAYIFVERVAQQAVFVNRQENMLSEKNAKALILGQVIAHEAGHLMLPHDSHSARGIMQARLGMDSLKQATRGGLLFTAEQTKQIRTVLISRAEAN